jgi:hypothetical protein
VIYYNLKIMNNFNLCLLLIYCYIYLCKGNIYVDQEELPAMLKVIFDHDKEGIDITYANFGFIPYGYTLKG